MLYFGSSDWKLYAIDLATGVKKWDFTTGYAIKGTPFLSGNTIYFGSTDGTLYALDANTGAKQWAYSTSNAIISSPAILNGIIYFISSNNNLYAVDITNGKKIWSYYLDIPATLGGSLKSPLLVSGSGQSISAFSAR